MKTTSANYYVTIRNWEHNEFCYKFKTKKDAMNCMILASKDNEINYIELHIMVEEG